MSAIEEPMKESTGHNPFVAPRSVESMNARSKTITAATSDTYGTLNQHLIGNLAYQVGVHDNVGQRRTMEDAYSFVVDFAGIRGQGYFAIFDGHAGKHAAEWCGQHFHEHLLECLRSNPDLPIPDVLNLTFHSVDSSLSAIAASDDKKHSGCTVVTAMIRLEDANKKQSFLPSNYNFGFTTDPAQASDPPANDAYPTPNSSKSNSPSPSPTSSPRANSPTTNRKKHKTGAGSRIVNAIKSFSNSNSQSEESPSSPNGRADVFIPPTDNLRRILYTANAGDARAVLCRGGKAVRLTYDHKGSDRQEAKRITDAGGFVMGGRVNGVLAVTRSLGDSSMKEFVVGAPYTTETELSDDDEFLILACDGLWDVTTDQEAIELVRNEKDAQKASKILVDHALNESSSDNVTAVVIRFPIPGSGGSGTALEN